MTGWFIVSDHRRTFTGWTGSLMGCEQKTQRRKYYSLRSLRSLWLKIPFFAVKIYSV
jgi:hypothetical protein